MAIAVRFEPRNRFHFGLLLIGLVALGGISNYFLEHVLRLSCPIRSVTGLQCPGCGSTRCLEALGNGDLLEALKQNAMIVGATVVVSAYLLLGLVAPTAAHEIRGYVQLRLRTATWTLVAAVGVFTLLRNFPGLPRASL